MFVHTPDPSAGRMGNTGQTVSENKAGKSGRASSGIGCSIKIKNRRYRRCKEEKAGRNEALLFLCGENCVVMYLKGNLI